MRFQDEGVVGVHFNKFFFSLTSFIKSQKARYRSNGLFSLAPQEGLEPPTFWSVAKRSIQLSYAHKLLRYAGDRNRTDTGV